MAEREKQPPDDQNNCPLETEVRTLLHRLLDLLAKKVAAIIVQEAEDGRPLPVHAKEVNKISDAE